MNQEIERKFLIKKIPDLKKIKPVIYNRHFIFKDKKTEIRIQKRGTRYELERKEKLDNISFNKVKIKISKKEFDTFKKISLDQIKRKSYLIKNNPNITIKIYQGKHSPLKRVEVEFKSKKEANNFKVPSWFGKEITGSPLAKDSKLSNLSSEKIKKLLTIY
jgi:CYTH domain-containing protein